MPLAYDIFPCAPACLLGSSALFSPSLGRTGV